MLHVPEEPIPIEQKPVLARPDESGPEQFAQRFFSIAILNRHGSAEHGLQSLDRQFHLANATASKLHASFGFFPSDHLLINQPFDPHDLRQDGLRLRLAVDKGPDDLQKALPEGYIPGDRAGFDQRQSLPGLSPPALVISAVFLERPDDRSRFSLRRSRRSTRNR